MKFQPSFGRVATFQTTVPRAFLPSWGAPEIPPPSTPPIAAGTASPVEDDSTEQMIKDYAPVVQAVSEQLLDPTQQAEVLRAKIKNTKQMMRGVPTILQGPLQMRLRNLQARLKAAERRQALQRESESARRTWRTLGQIGIVSGIIVAAAVAIRVARR